MINLYLCIIVTTVTVMSITIKLIAMRFFDREQEFEKLREIEELSHEVAQFTIPSTLALAEFFQSLYEGPHPSPRQ